MAPGRLHGLHELTIQPESAAQGPGHSTPRKWQPSSQKPSSITRPTDSHGVSTLHLRLLPATPHPLGKLLPLPPDIHEPGPGLEHFERVADIIPAHLPTSIQEPFLALPLDLAGPHPPLDRPERRGAERQPEADHRRGDDGLDGYVEGKRDGRRAAAG